MYVHRNNEYAAMFSRVTAWTSLATLHESRTMVITAVWMYACCVSAVGMKSCITIGTSRQQGVYVTGKHLALATLGASLGHDLAGLSSTLGLR